MATDQQYVLCKKLGDGPVSLMRITDVELLPNFQH